MSVAEDVDAFILVMEDALGKFCKAFGSLGEVVVCERFPVVTVNSDSGDKPDVAVAVFGGHQHTAVGESVFSGYSLEREGMQSCGQRKETHKQEQEWIFHGFKSVFLRISLNAKIAKTNVPRMVYNGINQKTNPIYRF